MHISCSLSMREKMRRLHSADGDLRALLIIYINKYFRWMDVVINKLEQFFEFKDRVLNLNLKNRVLELGFYLKTRQIAFIHFF